MRSAETSSQKWLLQIRKGELRLINELGELIRLILERRIDRKAVLFKITEEGRVIGDLPEFAELFEGGPLTPPVKLAGSDTVGALDGDQSFGTEDEVPYLDTISPLGSTADAFGDEYYEIPRRRWPAVLLVAAAMAVIGLGGYLALNRKPSATETALAVNTAPVAPTPAPVAVPPPAPTPPPVAPTPPPPAPEPIAAAAPPPEPTPPPPTVEEPPPPAAKVEEPPPAPEPTRTAPPARVAVEKRAPVVAARAAVRTRPEPREEPAAAGRRSYESLVSEGDRLIETGKTKKAMALFQEASRLRPDGVAALTGIAYGWLDRGDARRAAEFFQQAMIKDGHYAPALFGLGEAYREQGRKNEALSAFKLYLNRYPSTRQASAARRQVEQLSVERAR